MNAYKNEPVRHSTSGWLTAGDCAGEDRMRLFCFANAGGSVEIFRCWQEFFGDSLRVCPMELPGRGRRFTEPFFESIEEAAESAARDILPFTSRNYALFGHSLGSLIALETARVLEKLGAPPACCFFPSGRGAPHFLGRECPQFHDAEDAAIVAELKRLGGTPPEILADPDFLAMVINILRHDYKLLETHPFSTEPKIHAPVSVCSGSEDPDATEERLRAWADLTVGPCAVRLFPGGHFFVQQEKQAMARHLGAFIQMHSQQGADCAQTV